MKSRNGAETLADRNSPSMVCERQFQLQASGSHPVNLHTIDKTIIESVGSGVAYTSGGGWSALGIGGRSGFGDCGIDVPSCSSAPPFLQRLKKLARRGIAEKDTRPEGWREYCGWSCAGGSSLAEESWTPNVRFERTGLPAGEFDSLIRLR